ncbi:MAG: TonB family protein, partial [Bryobacteraceae bacterium]
YDPSGGVVPEARIRVTNVTSKGVELAAADATGSFSISGLAPGRYHVEVARPGFALYVQKDIALEAGQVLRRNVFLEVGKISEAVTVTARSPRPAAPPAAAPARIRVGGHLQATRLLNRVPPTYPDYARDNGIEGTVLMRAVISKDGSLLNLGVINTQVDATLARAAMDAVSQWRYQPTLLNGQPVEVITTIDVHFRLEQ